MLNDNLPTWCTGNEPDAPYSEVHDWCPDCGERCLIISDEDGIWFLHPSTESYKCPEND